MNYKFVLLYVTCINYCNDVVAHINNFNLVNSDNLTLRDGILRQPNGIRVRISADRESRIAVHFKIFVDQFSLFFIKFAVQNTSVVQIYFIYVSIYSLFNVAIQ